MGLWHMAALQVFLPISDQKLTTIDWFDALISHCPLESHASSKGSMVSTGTGRHSSFLTEFGRRPGFHKTMREGIVCINMQMDERWGFIFSIHGDSFACLWGKSFLFLEEVYSRFDSFNKNANCSKSILAAVNNGKN